MSNSGQSAIKLFNYLKLLWDNSSQISHWKNQGTEDEIRNHSWSAKTELAAFKASNCKDRIKLDSNLKTLLANYLSTCYWPLESTMARWNNRQLRSYQSWEKYQIAPVQYQQDTLNWICLLRADKPATSSKLTGIITCHGHIVTVSKSAASQEVLSMLVMVTNSIK